MATKHLIRQAGLAVAVLFGIVIVLNSIVHREAVTLKVTGRLSDAAQITSLQTTRNEGENSNRQRKTEVISTGLNLINNPDGASPKILIQTYLMFLFIEPGEKKSSPSLKWISNEVFRICHEKLFSSFAPSNMESNERADNLHEQDRIRHDNFKFGIDDNGRMRFDY